MKRTPVIAALICCAVLCVAQQPTPDQLLAKARTTYDEQGARPALPLFDAALKAYRDSGDRRGEAITVGLIGNCYKHLGEMDRALQMLESSLAIKRELKDGVEQAKTLNNIGLLYWEQSKFKDAAGAYESAVQIVGDTNPMIRAAVLNNLGLTHSGLGQYQQARKDFEDALAAARAAKFERGASDALGNLGGLDMDLGHYTEALAEYGESTAIAEHAGLKPSVMQNLGNSGLIYTAIGRIPEALAAFDRASTMAVEQGLKREEADWRKGKGTALAQTGRYDAAIAELRNADHMYAESGAARQRVEVLNDLGDIYLSLGDVASAEKQFQSAATKGRSIGYAQGVQTAVVSLADVETGHGKTDNARDALRGALKQARAAGDVSTAAEVLIHLAALDRTQKRYSDAARDAAEATRLAKDMGSPVAEARALVQQSENAIATSDYAAALERVQDAASMAEAAGDPELSWRVAYAKGRALEGSKRFDEAVTAYRKAVMEIERVRDQLHEERFRAGYLQTRYDVYIALVRLLIKLHRFNEAFSFSERLRARSYQDFIDRDTTSSPELVELRARIRRLQMTIESQAGKAADEQRSARDAYSDELAAAEARYQELIDDLRSRNPSWAVQRGLLTSSSDEVSRALHGDAALLEYVVGERSTSMLCMAHQTLRGATVPITSADLTAKVELLRDLISQPERDDWRGPASSLYQQLIAPAASTGCLRSVHRLYIVPHGILHYLPFEVLLKPSGTTSEYLVQQYSLKLLPSASLLAVDRQPSSSGGTLLSVAPARARLRFAAQEAESVVRLSPAGSFALVGTSATKDRFTQIAGNYDLLHLATHGYFNRMNPMFSGIQLQPHGSDDGTLHVYEIVGLQLRARLVTLSACETALGSGFFSDLPPGDEFVGLTRAFLSAGAGSVMATLWEVNDRSTVNFMLDFYKRASVADSADALAAAQRAMSASGSYRHPYYWAAFVLSGVGK